MKKLIITLIILSSLIGCSNSTKEYKNFNELIIKNDDLVGWKNEEGINEFGDKNGDVRAGYSFKGGFLAVKRLYGSADFMFGLNEDLGIYEYTYSYNQLVEGLKFEDGELKTETVGHNKIDKRVQYYKVLFKFDGKYESIIERKFTAEKYKDKFGCISFNDRELFLKMMNSKDMEVIIEGSKKSKKIKINLESFSTAIERSGIFKK